MKKVLALALILVFALTFVACGSDDNQNNANNANNANSAINQGINDLNSAIDSVGDSLNDVASQIQAETPVVTNPLVGKWQVEHDGESLIFELKDGGIAIVTYASGEETQSIDATWAADNGNFSIVSVADGTDMFEGKATYVLSGNQLSITYNNETEVFTKIG